MEDHKELAINIASKAIQYVGKTNSIASLKHIAIICDNLKLQKGKYDLLTEKLTQYLPGVRLIEIDFSHPEEFSDLGVFVLERPRGLLLDEAQGAMPQSPVKAFWANVSEAGLMPKCIFLLGNPYFPKKISIAEDTCIVKTFSDSSPSITALIEWIGSNS
jgi:hypothetical protein